MSNDNMPTSMTLKDWRSKNRRKIPMRLSFVQHMIVDRAPHTIIEEELLARRSQRKLYSYLVSLLWSIDVKT